MDDKSETSIPQNNGEGLAWYFNLTSSSLTKYIAFHYVERTLTEREKSEEGREKEEDVTYDVYTHI